MAGTVDMGFSPVQGAVSSITTGKVRALAVTGSRRIKSLPDVPSLSEAGFKGLLRFPMRLPAVIPTTLGVVLLRRLGCSFSATHRHTRRVFSGRQPVANQLR